MAQKRRNVAVGLLPNGRVLAAVLVVSVIAGMAFAALSRRDRAPAEPPGSGSDCEDADPLYVTADPAIAPTLSALTAQHSDAVASGDRPCKRIEVRAMPAPDVVAALLRGWDTAADGPPPDVWVPDSSAWLDVYRSESDNAALLPEESLVLARSPMVFAMPEPMADALPEATLKWRDLLALPDLELGWKPLPDLDLGRYRRHIEQICATVDGLPLAIELVFHPRFASPQRPRDHARSLRKHPRIGNQSEVQAALRLVRRGQEILLRRERDFRQIVERVDVIRGESEVGENATVVR